MHKPVTVNAHGLKEVRKTQVRVQRGHLGYSPHATDEQAEVRRSEKTVSRVKVGLEREACCLTSRPSIFHCAMI